MSRRARRDSATGREGDRGTRARELLGSFRARAAARSATTGSRSAGPVADPERTTPAVGESVPAPTPTDPDAPGVAWSAVRDELASVSAELAVLRAAVRALVADGRGQSPAAPTSGPVVSPARAGDRHPAVGSSAPVPVPDRVARHRPSGPPGRVGSRRSRPRRYDYAAAAVLLVSLVAAGVVVLLTNGRSTTASPPTPPSPVSSALAGGPAPGGSAASATPAPRSSKSRARNFTCASHRAGSGGPAPVALCIPSLGVDTTVIGLGLNADRTVQVPPLSQVGEAGWYRYSAAPGTVGPTVILGHIDSAQYGEGVFFQLGRLRPGAIVELWRGDGRLATYRVDNVQEQPKTRFPTDAVYGPTSGPAVRLVTCGGQFDSVTGNYLDNIIAYGTLLSLRDA